MRLARETAELANRFQLSLDTQTRSQNCERASGPSRIFSIQLRELFGI